jgi:hypothetical protein
VILKSCWFPFLLEISCMLGERVHFNDSVVCNKPFVWVLGNVMWLVRLGVTYWKHKLITFGYFL